MLKFLELADALTFYQKIKVVEMVFNEYAEEDEIKEMDEEAYE